MSTAPTTPTAADRRSLALLCRLAGALRCCRQDVFCEGLTFSQFLILDLAQREPGLPLARVGEELGVDKSTASRQIKPLVTDGLLGRKIAQGDGRAVSLDLTGPGREALERVWACVALFLRGVSQRLPRGRENDVMETVGMFLQAMDQAWNAQCCGASQIGEKPHER
jgi:DNA-binding MarR family transcriptional regulator